MFDIKDIQPAADEIGNCGSILICHCGIELLSIGILKNTKRKKIEAEVYKTPIEKKRQLT
jgi:hypothetical protein